MMTRSRIYVCLLLCIVTGFVSCGLNEEIGGAISEEDLLTESGVELNIVAPVYGSLTNLINTDGSWWALQVISSDEGIVPCRAGGAWCELTYQDLHQHNWDKFDPIIRRTWFSLEEAVSQSNTAIYLLKSRQNSDPKLIKSLVAELRFLRGYFRFLQLDLFRKVPFRDENDQDFTKPPPVKSGLEAYLWLEDEVLGIIPDLKAPGEVDYGRVTLDAAYMLLAKLYLNAEVYTGTPQWEKARAACQEVINRGHFNLANDYFGLFGVGNDLNNPEAIFVIRQSLGSDNRILFSPPHTLHYGQDLGTGIFTWNGYCATREFFHSWDEDGDSGNGIQTQDKRFYDDRIKSATGANLGFLQGPQVDPNGDPIINLQLNVQLNYTPEVQLYGALSHEGVRVLKYEPDTESEDALWRGRNDFILFRYADLYLMNVEALYRLGRDGEALGLLNGLRKLRGAKELSQINAEVLLAERGFELYWEGWRRQDQVRFGHFTDAWEHKPAGDPSQNFFPIPQAALDVNPNLK